MYKPLLKLRVIPETGQVERLERLIDEQKLSVALGQVVLICFHFATALGIVLKNPMVFNGPKSYIHSEETLEARKLPYKLFIPSKGEHN